jgi:hypothetical protein
MVAAAQTTTNADLYITALIAVGGAIIGALIAGVTQSLTTRSASRNQLAALQLQLDHQTQDAIRKERLRTYARYLAALHALQSKTIDIYEAEVDRPRWKRRKPIDLTKEVDELRDSAATVDLLATEQLSDLVTRMQNQMVTEIDMALSGENPDRGHESGLVFPSMILAVMQAELGVREGITVDQETGLHDSGTYHIEHPIPSRSNS